MSKLSDYATFIAEEPFFNICDAYKKEPAGSNARANIVQGAILASESADYLILHKLKSLADKLDWWSEGFYLSTKNEDNED